MTTVRRRLRAVAAIWLLWQTASLAAFVPVDCCASHRPAPVEVESSCHRVPPPPDHHGSHDAAPARDNDCRMTSACNGPGEALLGIFAYNGVVSERAPFDADLTADLTAPSPATAPRPLAAPPDAPPPRS